MNEFLEKLKEIRPDIDFEVEDALIDDGLLASFDILRIVAMIEEEYEVKVPVKELKPANFNSAEALFALVERLEDE